MKDFYEDPELNKTFDKLSDAQKRHIEVQLLSVALGIEGPELFSNEWMIFQKHYNPNSIL